jgi:hypothetical protein
MQKKILFSIMAMLMLLLVGCEDKMGAEAKVSFASVAQSGTDADEKLINITVTLGNSVFIDKVEEVMATVNNSTDEKSLKIINRKIDDTNKVISIYALFDKDDNKLYNDTTSSYSIKIKSIKCKDENGNTVYVEGVETIAKQTVAISTTSGGGTTTIDLTPVSTLKGEAKATTSGYVVTLTWNAHALGKGYKIYREDSTDSIATGADINIKGSDVVATSLESYEDIVTPGKTYFYRVTAFDGTNETYKQTKAFGVKVVESQTGTTTGTVTVPQVANVTAEPDTDSILLTWEAITSTNPEIIGYNIYGSATINGTYQKLVTTSNPNIIKANKLTIKKGDKFGDLELKSGMEMFFRVRAVALSGDEGNFSVAAMIQTMYDSTVPIIQSASEIKLVPYGNTTVTTGTLGVKLEWVNKGVEGYIIERADDAPGQAFSKIATVLQSTGIKTSIIDGSFMDLKNKKAFYRIRCITSTGAIGRPSGSVIAEDYKNMLIPTITTTANYLGLDTVTIGATTTKYKFYYDGPDINGVVSINDAVVTGLPLDFAGYKVYMSNSFDGEYTLIDKVSGLWMAEVTVANTVLDPTKPIYVRVSTYDYFGNESEISLRSSNLN